MTAADIKNREQADAEQDARREKSAKQCKRCYYCKIAHNMNFWYCDYVSWEGKLRDKGEGPGKCGSFKPRKKLTKREMVDRAERSISRCEAECVKYKKQKHEVS